MSRDLRKYARQTDLRLVAGFLVLLLVVGLGLIYLFLGPNAAWLGLLCLLLALAPVALIWLALTIIAWIVAKANQE